MVLDCLNYFLLSPVFRADNIIEFAFTVYNDPFRDLFQVYYLDLEIIKVYEFVVQGGGEPPCFSA